MGAGVLNELDAYVFAPGLRDGEQIERVEPRDDPNARWHHYIHIEPRADGVADP
jgi:hypothetical protein